MANETHLAGWADAERRNPRRAMEAACRRMTAALIGSIYVCKTSAKTAESLGGR